MMDELIKKLEKVDLYFIEKTYFPSYELRLNIREAIDFVKMAKLKEEQRVKANEA